MKLEYTNQQNAINQLSFNNAHSLFSHTDGLKIIVEDADNIIRVSLLSHALKLC